MQLQAQFQFQPRSQVFDLLVSFGSSTFNTMPCPGICWVPYSDWWQVSEPEATKARVASGGFSCKKTDADWKYPKQQGVYDAPDNKSRGRAAPGLLNSVAQQRHPLSTPGVSS